ncbi:hypothetical protein BC829DRAFT_91674 [Chytridium lagenaria]|nr:hypothetical protein BC829DRAFT_91674 [Chytridium lagenaria]
MSRAFKSWNSRHDGKKTRNRLKMASEDHYRILLRRRALNVWISAYCVRKSRHADEEKADAFIAKNRKARAIRTWIYRSRSNQELSLAISGMQKTQNQRRLEQAFDGLLMYTHIAD